MSKEGYFSTVITANVSNGMRPAIKKNNPRSDIRLISIGDFWFGPKSIYVPGIIKYYTQVRKSISKLVSSKRYDIIHAHGVTAAFPLSYVETTSCKIATIHGDPRLTTPFYFIFPTYFINRLNTFNYIISVSRRVAELLVAQGLRVPLTIIPNWVSQKFISTPPRSTDSIHQNFSSSLKIIFIGRIDPKKNIDELLRALQIVNSKIPVVLRVVGSAEDLTYLHKLKRLASKLGINERVFWLGHRSDILELLDSSDIFVLPSSSEGLPIALLEAMARQVPVIGTDVGDMGDIIRSSKGGIVIKQPDHKAIAEAILFLSSHSVRKEMGKRGRDFILRYHEPRSCLAKLMQIYEECADTVS